MDRKAEAAPNIDALEVEVQTVLREIDAERRSLRPLIMAGDDSAPIRARIAALEARLTETKARIDELVAQRSAQLADDVARDAAETAGKIATAIAAKLAALQPPEHPTK